MSVPLSLGRRVLHVIHTLSNSHILHFIPDPPLILHLIDLGLLFLDVLLSLLLVNLFLKSLLHCNLLGFSLILNDMFLIPSLHENISMSLKLKVNSVFQYSSSGLDVWEILLGDRSIEVPVVYSFILDVKSLVVRVKCLLLLFLDVDAVLLPLCLLPLFFFAKIVTLFHLSL